MSSGATRAAAASAAVPGFRRADMAGYAAWACWLTLGAGLSSLMQNPWTLLSFAAVSSSLALAMFGFYEPRNRRAVLRDRLCEQDRSGRISRRARRRWARCPPCRSALQ